MGKQPASKLHDISPRITSTSLAWSLSQAPHYGPWMARDFEREKYKQIQCDTHLEILVCPNILDELGL